MGCAGTTEGGRSVSECTKPWQRRAWNMTSTFEGARRCLLGCLPHAELPPQHDGLFFWEQQDAFVMGLLQQARLLQQLGFSTATETKAGGVTPFSLAQASFSCWEKQQQSRQQASAFSQPQGQFMQG